MRKWIEKGMPKVIVNAERHRRTPRHWLFQLRLFSLRLLGFVPGRLTARPLLDPGVMFAAICGGQGGDWAELLTRVGTRGAALRRYSRGVRNLHECREWVRHVHAVASRGRRIYERYIYVRTYIYGLGIGEVLILFVGCWC